MLSNENVELNLRSINSSYLWSSHGIGSLAHCGDKILFLLLDCQLNLMT
jgi:hypothetical protein